MQAYRRIPADPADWFSPEEVRKAKDYQRPLTRVRIADSIVTLAVILAVILTGAPPRAIDAVGAGAWPLQVVVVIGFLMLVTLPFDLPFAIWRTFVHEEKWGFNTQTPKGFVVDLFKGLLLNVVLLSILLIPVWAVIRATALWWVWAWLVFLVFGVLMGMLYPVVIAPIFNKFSPLADESLAGRLRDLATRAGVRISEVLVMDASKRTKKDNAYFTGLGGTRRVVLFDNLLEQPAEAVETVVAHEIGHWRRGHIYRGIGVGAALSFLMFLVVQAIVTAPAVLDAAQVDSIRDPGAIPLFLAAFIPLTVLTGLVQSWFSRAWERQADMDALELTSDPGAFREMMRGLQTKNLMDIAPGRWAYLRASHPPGAERLELSKLWEQERVQAS